MINNKLTLFNQKGIETYLKNNRINFNTKPKNKKKKTSLLP